MTERARRKRRELFRMGRRGSLVRGVLGTNHGAAVCIVSYPTSGGRARAFFPATAQGKAEAKLFADAAYLRLTDLGRAAPGPITLDELWRRFSESHFAHLRLRSRRLYDQYWKHFANFAGPHTLAGDATTETLERLRAAMDRKPYAVNTIMKTMNTVRMVFRWAEARELIGRNRVGLYVYRVAKEQRPVSPAEFRDEDFRALLATLKPDHGQFWRPLVALTLCGLQGARQHAVLHLRWDDVRWDTGQIRWDAAWDKNGVTWLQPMRAGSRAALELARAWADRLYLPGPWVLPGYSRRHPDQPYTIGALWRALVRAERLAGIPHLKGRGGHGLRRMLSGDVNELTGNAKLALEAIGDRDIRQATRYLKPREDAIRAVFDRLDARSDSETAARGKAKS